MRVVLGCFFSLLLTTIIIANDIDRNPSEPTIKQLYEQQKMILTGIIWDQYDPIAIVETSGGTHVLRVGETYAKATVITIDKTEMIVSQNQTTTLIKLNRQHEHP